MREVLSPKWNDECAIVTVKCAMCMSRVSKQSLKSAGFDSKTADASDKIQFFIDDQQKPLNKANLKRHLSCKSKFVAFE